MAGLDPRRADIAVAGSVLLDCILRRLGAADITLCDLSLREGLVLDYIQRNTAKIRKIDRYPDVRRRSVIELAERYGYNAAHARHVAQLALALFDQTRAVHALRRSRARMARVRRPAARRRRPHQLRAPSPPLVLPDQERRAARVRSAGDRDHRAAGALSSTGDAEEIARRVRTAQGRAAARGAHAGGDAAAGGRTRSQPRADRHRHRRRPERGDAYADPPARRGRRGTRAVGRRPPRRARSSGSSNAAAVRGVRAPVEGREAPPRTEGTRIRC